MIEGCELIHADCLDAMSLIPDGTVDLIAADLPYGTTACKWDVVIPFGPLWAHYRRILKPRGAIVLTACQPFTSMLVMSNQEWFRYRWVWDKVNRPTGFLDAKTRPLRIAEDVLVFGPKPTTYNPQMTIGEPYVAAHGKHGTVYGDQRRTVTVCKGERYPRDIIRIKADRRGTEGRIHPTQKPVALFEYLIRTYSNPGDLVLDNAMGSGTTGEACIKTGRRFIGIERDPKHFGNARARLNFVQRPLLMSS
jgi:site-specific DNA-methyltransferase (adenine-specific)